LESQDNPAQSPGGRIIEHLADGRDTCLLGLGGPPRCHRLPGVIDGK
jgi:hypothetical protein